MSPLNIISSIIILLVLFKIPFPKVSQQSDVASADAGCTFLWILHFPLFFSSVVSFQIRVFLLVPHHSLQFYWNLSFEMDESRFRFFQLFLDLCESFSVFLQVESLSLNPMNKEKPWSWLFVTIVFIPCQSTTISRLYVY